MAIKSGKSALLWPFADQFGHTDLDVNLMGFLLQDAG